MKTIAGHRSTIQSLNTNIASLSSGAEVLRNSRSDAKSLRDRAKGQDGLLAAESSIRFQQFVDFAESCCHYS